MQAYFRVRIDLYGGGVIIAASSDVPKRSLDEIEWHANWIGMKGHYYIGMLDWTQVRAIAWELITDGK